MRQDQPVFIAIGSNLPGLDGRSPAQNCLRATQRLRGLPGLRLACVSNWYATTSIPPGSADYVNGMALLMGTPDPAWLLTRLQTIEAEFGRTRPGPDAPRTLDLDIIAIGQTVRATPDPILPHPRAHLRRFVLQPLTDLMPDWVHPLIGQTAQHILATLPDQGITRL